MMYFAHFAINDVANAACAKIEAAIRQGSHRAIRGDVDMFLEQKLAQVSTFYQIVYRKDSGWP